MSVTTRSGACSRDRRRCRRRRRRPRRPPRSPNRSSSPASPSRSSTPSSASTIRGIDDAHGSSTRTQGRPAGRAGQQQSAADRRDPVGQPGQAGARRRVGAAARRRRATSTHEPVAVHAGRCTAACAAPRVPGDVGQRLRHHEVGGGLHRRGQPRGQRRRATVDRAPGSGRPARATRRGQPPVGQDLRVDAADQVAQLGQRQLRLLVRLADAAGGRRARRQVQLGQAELHGQATSRCWAPSCRSRSIRRRSASKASTSRVRDRVSSMTRCASSVSRAPSSNRASMPWSTASAVSG